MLSRVADSLYWMSRYVERAEHTTRVLDVNLHGRLDQTRKLAGEEWLRVMRSLGVQLPEGTSLDPARIVDRLTFARSEPHSVVACIHQARQNAREVREQISSEMWEQINWLHLHVQGARRRMIAEGPTYELFQGIKRGLHLFEGICTTTMSRQEGWYFIQLGRYLERVINTVNLLDAHFRQLPGEGAASGDAYFEWVGLLKSCTALEAYWRAHSADVRPEKGAAFLLLDADFPHSVRFGVEEVRESLAVLSEVVPVLKRGDVHRRVGKLLSALSYDSIEEIMERDMCAFLASVRQGCMDIHDAVYLASIAYPVDHALTA